MKKTYTQPDIVYEDFSLSAGIAGNCEIVIHNATQNVCGMKMGGEMLFLNSVSLCLDKAVDGSPEYNGLCYHVPIDTKNIFNS